MMRIFCDGCDRDISEEPYVSVRINSRGSALFDHRTKIKPDDWDWCIMCATNRSIKIAEEN